MPDPLEAMDTSMDGLGWLSSRTLQRNNIDPFATPKPGKTVPPADTGQAAAQLPGQIANMAWRGSGMGDIYDAMRQGGTWTDVGAAAIPAVMGAAMPEGRGAGKGLEAAAEAAPNYFKGITAYHGSPYDFDRFDLSKIGTGEGAQAYGHGLYFAGNEGTALTYKNAPRVTDMDWPVSGTDYTVPAWVARSAQTPQGLEEVRNNFVGRLQESQAEHAAGDWNAASRVYNQQRIIDALDAVKSGAQLQKPGKMYQVNINADPEHFLDWDKPLSEQPHILEKVPELAEAAKKEAYSRALGATHQDRADQLWSMVKDPTKAPAEFAIQAMAPRMPGGGREAEFSAMLKDRGIPGIKYLDQGSRSGGAGTHNYVVFDDKMVDIIKKYGLAGLIAGGASHFQLPASNSNSQ